MNMIFERKLAIPQEVKKMFPLDNELHSLVQKRDNEIKKILSGEDDRLLLIIGPCSADNEDSASGRNHHHAARRYAPGREPRLSRRGA